MEWRRRHSFTLMEILIAIGILTAILGVSGLRVHRLLEEQRFYSSVDRLVERIQLSQDLMLLAGRDHELLLFEKDGILASRYQFDAPLPKSMERQLSKDLSMPGLRYLAIHNGREFSEVDDLRLPFMSRGSRLPKMVMELSSAKPGSKGRLTKYVALKGYLHPVRAENELDENVWKEESVDVWYPLEIL